jgi:hypothetical protein
MFVGKAMSLPLKWTSVRASTLVSSGLASKFQTLAEVANTLAYYDKSEITAVKSFILMAPGVTFTTPHFV